MKRHHTFTTIAITILATSAIASAGIYSVVTVVRGSAAFLDDADAPAPDAIEGQVAPAPLPPPRAPADAAVEGSVLVRVNRLSGGLFVPAGGAELLVVDDGEVLDRQTSQQDGSVPLDLPDGIYSLLARGSDGFAVARTVLAGDSEALVMGLCPPVDMPAIDSILQTDVFGSETVATVGDEVESAGWLDLFTDPGFVLRDDGTISGRLTRTHDLDEAPHSIVNSRVLFIRAGAIVAEGLTDESGAFELSGLDPGAYSFVAASNLGMVALAVEVYPAIEVAGPRGTEVRFVSFDDGTNSNAEPAPPEDILAGGGTAAGPVPGPGPGVGGFGPFGPPPFGGGGGGLGGGGGGFAGGGGFGDGGGILGPLLAGLAGAALGWAIADEDGDDDDDVVSP